MHAYRITFTPEPEVADEIRRQAAKQGISISQVVNRLIKQARGSATEEPKREPFVVRAKAMGLRPGFDEARIKDYLEELEIEPYDHP